MIVFFSLVALLFIPWIVQKALCQSTPESELYTRIGWLFILFFLFDQMPVLWASPLFYLFLLAGGCEIWYLLIFRSNISEISLEALFLSNTKESTEFVKNYFSWKDFLAVLIYVGLTLFLFYSQPITQPAMIHVSWPIAFAVLVTVVLIKAGLQQNFKDVIPGVLGKLPTYLKLKIRTDKLIAKRASLIQSIDDKDVVFSTSQAPITQIIVIGESASRRHHQIYGYPRETTPHQASFQAELVIFEDMISNFAQTNPSLSYFLTQAEQSSSLSPDEAPSFIDIAKKAGIQTWWISNQDPSNSTPNAIAKSTHHPFFLMLDSLLEQFDDALLVKVAEAVLSEHPHKLIVVHLNGSHFQYKERYPDRFDFFKTAEKINAYAPKISAKATEIINQYDNSIRYTDFILNEIRELLIQSEQASVMTYLSDHGEEVFDSQNFKGHEPTNFSKPMFEVPFWVWCSPTFRSRYPAKISSLINKQHSPIILEDLFHFVVDALDIQTSYLRHDRSWWRDEFVTRPRKVYDKDFDDWQP